MFFLSEASFLIVSLSHGLSVYYVYSSPGNSWLDYFISTVFVGLNWGYLAVIGFCLVSKVPITHVLSRPRPNRNTEEAKAPHNYINSSISLYSD